MSSQDHSIVLYYKYVTLPDPEAVLLWQKELCEKMDLTGRVLISKEGVNATLEGSKKNIRKYTKIISKYTPFENIHFKFSDGNGQSFPKLSIKLRDEIVSTHLGPRDINPIQITGKYLTAEQLHQWFLDKKEFYIVDMRNDYEQTVGYFENSIFSDFGHFRDLPKILKKLDHLKHKTIVTVCTGGIRCEKASGFLVNNGFEDVYQLYGGIVTYMEKYPNEHFLGKLYVFDQRVIMGFNTDSDKHIIVGKCAKCGKPSENFVNCTYNDCHKHFICCTNCLSKDGKAYCDTSCESKNEQKYSYLEA